MEKIVISENVSLDGVIRDPAGDEGFRLGGWVGLIKDSPAHATCVNVTWVTPLGEEAAST